MEIQTIKRFENETKWVGLMLTPGIPESLSLTATFNYTATIKTSCSLSSRTRGRWPGELKATRTKKLKLLYFVSYTGVNCKIIPSSPTSSRSYDLLCSFFESLSSYWSIKTVFFFYRIYIQDRYINSFKIQTIKIPGNKTKWDVF